MRLPMESDGIGSSNRPVGSYGVRLFCMNGLISFVLVSSSIRPIATCPVMLVTSELFFTYLRRSTRPSAPLFPFGPSMILVSYGYDGLAVMSI